ncbi:MAG TPA: hypothetical protein VKI41_14560 [Vicinamibacteria bacterium]|nr:hypothetical protein [Vicinamibacteria bacterium]
MDLPPHPTPDVFCADIGSVKRRRFGWAHVGPASSVEQGEDILDLINGVARCLARAGKAALGFGCPLFVPVAAAAKDLTRARAGEGSRAWSAVAGAGILAAGLTEVAWILKHIRSAVSADVPCVLSWDAFERAPSGFLLWEAFLPPAAQSVSHAGDALRAAHAFVEALPRPQSTVEPRKDEEVLSLLGAAMVWSGWRTDAAVLKEPCLVIKARESAGSERTSARPRLPSAGCDD